MLRFLQTADDRKYVQQRPRDTRPRGVRALEIHGFELDPKTLEVHGFWPKALKMHGFNCVPNT